MCDLELDLSISPAFKSDSPAGLLMYDFLSVTVIVMYAPTLVLYEAWCVKIRALEFSLPMSLSMFNVKHNGVVGLYMTFY